MRIWNFVQNAQTLWSGLQEVQLDFSAVCLDSIGEIYFCETFVFLFDFLIFSFINAIFRFGTFCPPCKYNSYFFLEVNYCEVCLHFSYLSELLKCSEFCLHFPLIISCVFLFFVSCLCDFIKIIFFICSFSSESSILRYFMFSIKFFQLKNIFIFKFLTCFLNFQISYILGLYSLMIIFTQLFNLTN